MCSINVEWIAKLELTHSVWWMSFETSQCESNKEIFVECMQLMDPNEPIVDVAGSILACGDSNGYMMVEPALEHAKDPKALAEAIIAKWDKKLAEAAERVQHERTCHAEAVESMKQLQAEIADETTKLKDESLTPAFVKNRQSFIQSLTETLPFHKSVVERLHRAVEREQEKADSHLPENSSNLRARVVEFLAKQN
jgi:hypothetical protein